MRPTLTRYPPPRSDSSPAAETVSVTWEHSTPESVGPFRILETLGQGGMGVVYLAEQASPVRRRVALKLVRMGMSTEEVLGRFESERQALALLNHTSIAKIFEAGVSEDGRPYFTMEYVPGVAVTEYCDKNRLSTRDRLEIFVHICEGVEHAHQKGIIHRDLKPGNILVTVPNGGPLPKIIDFGVAKATHQRLTEHTHYTEYGRVLGTPKYMSPEQADVTALGVDTRTDIYSLGVVLYELLAGALPFDGDNLAEGDHAELRRRIRDVDPPKPSTRISSLGEVSTDVAKRRRATPAVLSRLLRGDLDLITMKALEKDPSRRYQAVTVLSGDVRRYLAGEPVLAGPPGVTYLMGKLIRKHRGPVSAAAAVILALVGGLGLSLRMYQRARAAQEVADGERRKQEVEAERYKAISDFLENMITSVDAAEGVPGVTVADILAAAALEVERALGDRPELEMSLRHTIGRAYLSLGLFEEAETELQRAIALGEEHLEVEDLATLAAKSSLGGLRISQARFPEAEDVLQEVLDAHMRRWGPEGPDTLLAKRDIALLRDEEGRYEEAEAIYREVVEAQRRVHGDGTRELADTLSDLAGLLAVSGKPAEAEALYRGVLKITERILGPDHPDTLNSESNLGEVLRRRMRFQEAERHLRKALEGRIKRLGPHHLSTLSTKNSLAVLLRQVGRRVEAEPFFQDVMEGRRARLGPDHPRTLSAIGNYANLLEDTGHIDEAVALHKQVLEGRRRALGADHPRTWDTLQALAGVLIDAGEPAEAEPLVREAYERRLEKYGADGPETLRSGMRLAKALRLLGRLREADDLGGRILATGRVRFGDDYIETAYFRLERGICLGELGRRREGLSHMQAAVDVLLRELPEGHDHLQLALRALADSLEAAGEVEEAASVRRKLKD